MEAFMAWYSGNEFEQYVTLNRLIGPYAGSTTALLVLQHRRAAAALVQAHSATACSRLFVVAMMVNVGMWLERFIIVVTSLHRDYLPSSWDMYYPTFWDWATFIGTIGLFLCLLFLFLRFLPMISIFEMRTLLPRGAGEGGGAMTVTSFAAANLWPARRVRQPAGAGGRGAQVREAGLSADGRLFAFPDRGADRGAGLQPHAAAAGRA